MTWETQSLTEVVPSRLQGPTLTSRLTKHLYAGKLVAHPLLQLCQHLAVNFFSFLRTLRSASTSSSLRVSNTAPYSTLYSCRFLLDMSDSGLVDGVHAYWSGATNQTEYWDDKKPAKSGFVTPIPVAEWSAALDMTNDKRSAVGSGNLLLWYGYEWLANFLCAARLFP